MIHYHRLTLVVLAAALILTGCGRRTARESVGTKPPIYPDYKDVTVPCNIAPLDFEVAGATHIQATAEGQNSMTLEASGKEDIQWPLEDWHKLLMQNRGKTIKVTVSVWSDSKPDGVTYKPFTIAVDGDTIDGYVSYRLLPPGYVGWNKMAIMQRDLTDFDESVLVSNDQASNGCVNCHTPLKGSPRDWMMHVRSKGGGTVICQDGILSKTDISENGQSSHGTYPAWHPSGRYIVFSANEVLQAFYTHCQDKIEVFDMRSKLVIYDIARQTTKAIPQITDSLKWQTFPTFSPDGKWLYYCEAPSQPTMPYNAKDTHYSILRVAFDERTGSVGSRPDTVWSASRGGSASLPRISPDGKWLVFAHTGFGTFAIQHREADLWLINLSTGVAERASEINSAEAESFHSWSSDGRWLLYTSRRDDGRYTRLYIARFNGGRFSKPFMLPQKSPRQNHQRRFSYNVPELMKGKVVLDKDEFARFVKP